jgi:hypothetical protein
VIFDGELWGGEKDGGWNGRLKGRGICWWDTNKWVWRSFLRGGLGRGIAPCCGILSGCWELAMTLDGGWLMGFLDRWGEGIDGWGFFGTVIISFVRGASVNLVYDERVAFVDVASDAGGYGLRPAAAG